MPVGRHKPIVLVLGTNFPLVPQVHTRGLGPSPLALFVPPIQGAEPNFVDEDSGDTPLVLAARKDSPDLIKALVVGGAHLDFRTHRGGLTALHVVARGSQYRALTTLLDLGASPDYRDEQSLTPAYHACMM